jgi:UDP-N-acetylglucosamine acyltransferase
LYKEGRTQTGALDQIGTDLGHVQEVAEFVEFIRSSKIGISPARDPGRTRRSE